MVSSRPTNGQAHTRRLTPTARIVCAAVYVDAAHETSAALRDMTAYWPLLKPGGILFGDDAKNAAVIEAVRRFQEKFSAEIGRPYNTTGGPKNGRPSVWSLAKGDVAALPVSRESAACTADSQRAETLTRKPNDQFKCTAEHWEQWAASAAAYSQGRHWDWAAKSLCRTLYAR